VLLCGGLLHRILRRFFEGLAEVLLLYVRRFS